MALLRLWVLRIPKTVDAPASALPLPDLMALPVAAAAVEAGVARATEQGTKNPTARYYVRTRVAWYTGMARRCRCIGPWREMPTMGSMYGGGMHACVQKYKN
jgi:hypothetical protein